MENTTQTTETNPFIAALNPIPSEPKADVNPPSSTDPVVTDPAAKTEPAEPVKEELISPRIAAIVKREGALVKRERELKQKEEELKKMGEGKLSRDELMKTLMDEFEEDPYEFMTKNGFSYEKLQNRLLAGDEGLKVSKLEKELMALKKEREEEKNLKKTQAEKDQETQYEQQKQQAMDVIKSKVLESEEFELVANEGAFDLVYDVIQEYYEETNKILTIAEAAALVEKNLEDDFKKRLEYKKVKSWVTPSKEEKDPVQSKSPATSSPTPTETKTITSDMIPSGGSSKSDLELTDEERMEKAIRALRGEKV